jgi:hypothetical protein
MRKIDVKRMLIVLAATSILSVMSVALSAQELTPKKKSEKWGFVDSSGNEAISFIYDDARSFSEGLAAVKKDGKYGFIDKDGKEAVPCIYDYAESFIEGLAKVRKTGKY